MWLPATLIFSLLLCVPLYAQAQSSGTTRTYYLAADEVNWDYAHARQERHHRLQFVGMEQMTQRGPTKIGTPYKKAVREYTDSSFPTLKVRPAEWENLGFLGPVIQAEVGDSIRIVFRNNGRHPFSMHPHGVATRFVVGPAVASAAAQE